MKYAIGYKSSIKSETDEINNVIAHIENAYKKEMQKDEYFDKDVYNHKTGNITFISIDYVMIDDFYICDTVNVLINNLKIGDKVHYLTSQNNHGKEHKIEKVISVVDESWNNEIVNSQINIVKPQALTRCIIGKVTKRKNRLLIIEPHNITVDLNKVESEFIPVIGDWLKLESETEINEECYNLSGQILEIKKIQPLRSKLSIETVSSFDPIKEIGVIGKDTVFNKRVCDSGYIPCIDDKVISDSIESDQGFYTWRSLIVVPVFQASLAFM